MGTSRENNPVLHPHLVERVDKYRIKVNLSDPKAELKV